MIKKLFLNLIIISLFSLIVLVIVLSTTGIATDRFNKLISNKIDKEKNIKLDLKTINFKLDPKKLSLFLETQKPKINYKDLIIPVNNAKVYIDFLPLLKTNLNVNRINLVLDELDILEINKFSKFIKPSNFKNFLNNKIQKGKLTSEIEIFFKKNSITTFIVKGKVKDLEANVYNSLSLSKINFNFFADKEDVLIKNIFGKIQKINISDGNIKINLVNGLKLNSSFITKFNLNEKLINEYSSFFKKDNFINQIKLLSGNFTNNLSINLDNTNKLKDYEYSFSGTLEKGKFELPHTIKSDFIVDEINQVSIINTKLTSSLKPQNFKLEGNGKYSFNELDFLDFELENNSNDKATNLNLNFDYKNEVKIDLINYKKLNGAIANISTNLEKNDGRINIKKLDYSENKNLIKINNLILKDNNFYALKKLEVKTLNNNFSIKWNKKISIKGTKFDATNLPKIINNQPNSKKFKYLDNYIEIDFKSVKAPLSEKLQNFRLIGRIKEGSFANISAKGDFGDGNFLDLSIKKDKKTNKRYLEVYSDLTRPLLTEYSFFNGLSGGKLIFSSLIDGNRSDSKLKIQNFKVVNAPGVIKLLSLADLGGLADLVEGDGLSFNILEINMEKNNDFLKLNEIIALGPSVSVLMEGYQDGSGVTSLRGTLVPAKTLNKIISKIPLIGNIVIPKEVGEGLFGISFKMKGPKGKIKTSINPIRTLTPRFIQKIVDKNKEVK